MHVYTTLLQLPVLVLSPQHELLPPIEASRFRIRVAQHLPIQPTRVRQEGDDPINLDVLINLSGPEDPIAAVLPDALAAAHLNSTDHVSLYGVDCKLERSALGMPADPDALRLSVGALLKSTTMHGTKQRAGCAGSLKLWDAVAAVLQQRAPVSGRRVLLLVSTGYDAGSKHRTKELQPGILNHGVSIFALHDHALAMPGRAEEEYNLQSLCELTGGLVLQSAREDMRKAVSNFVAMVRGRYIIEFPRPRDSNPGTFAASVTINKMPDAFIRSAGVTSTVADPTPPPDENRMPVEPAAPSTSPAATPAETPAANPPPTRPPGAEPPTPHTRG